MRRFLSAIVVVAATTLGLSACKTTEDRWVRDQTPRSAVDQDKAECRYQAEQATATIGTERTRGGFSKAIGDGIGSGVAKGMEQAELIESCMKARGYRQ
jgi:hypothetical protein